MADDEKTEQPAAGQNGVEGTGATEKVGGGDTAAKATDQGCPVEMYGGRPCGRPRYVWPDPSGARNACLMHSQRREEDEADFHKEFERILTEAGEGTADFTGFIFSNAEYRGREFLAHCIFDSAVFLGNAKFRKAKFTKGADFTDTEFEGVVNFSLAEFSGPALFVIARFKLSANFERATCLQDADFGAAEFLGMADFRACKFKGHAEFSRATFTDDAAFAGATFRDVADFSEAKFGGTAEFGGANFAAEVGFSHTTFERLANFAAGSFDGPAKFTEAAFKMHASFWLASFNEVADFHHARFDGAVEFRETRIARRDQVHEAPIFVLAQCEKPECVVFYKTYLGRALLHNCDVSRFVFSNVEWRKRVENGKAAVFEEVIDLNGVVAAALQPAQGSPDERNYALIAELYQQLKKNYDDRRDYWTGGDWHYGEMEMKRLATPSPGRVARWLTKKGVNEKRLNRVRQLWHRQMGVAAWYKRASEYGESYGRPVVWLAAIVLLFTLLYPLAGLTPGAKQGSQAALGPGSGQTLAAPKLSYWALSEFVARDQAGWALGTAKFFGHSLMTTLGVAFFQRDLEYQPLYPWGRGLAWAQLLLSYTLVALFLLALRRQFRR